MSDKPKPETILFLSDARGIYIPRDFAQSIKKETVTGVKQEDWDILAAGPDAQWYWETWEEVIQHAVITEPDTGIQYGIYHNRDCWLIPTGMEWSDETEFFVWPENSDSDA